MEPFLRQEGKRHSKEKTQVVRLLKVKGGLPYCGAVFRILSFSEERGHYNVKYPRGGYKTHCTIFDLHFPHILLGNEAINVLHIQCSRRSDAPE